MIGKNKKFRNPLIGAIVIGATIFGIKTVNAEKTEPANQHSPHIEFTEIGEDSDALVLTQPFDPNTLGAEDWQKLGFSEKQAATILKYREVVGGEFTSKKQLQKCYAFSDEAFGKLEPFLLLPEDPEKSSSFTQQSFARKDKVNIAKRFNPDYSTAADWRAMGFSEKQAAAILKYRDYLGGSFVSKEKFRECFIISPENYAKLAPFLLLPETAAGRTSQKKFDSKQPGFQAQAKYELKNFNPNELDADGWKALGFSQRQAEVIINYRNSILKGSFKNLEQIQKCFVISPEKFEELKPYIQIPVETNGPSNVEKTIAKNPVDQTDFSKVDLNEITFKQLTEFGFTEKAAASFLGFRKNLGGFVNENQIFEVYGIDRSLGEKLVSTAFLTNSKVVKYYLTDAPESWLKTHPYFRYSADKIIYYRVTYPDDKKIWKQLKTKPEYEAKMRLYLKN